MSATMRLFTNANYTLHVIGMDLTSHDIWVSFRQGDYKVTLTSSDVTMTYDDTNGETLIDVILTQEQTSGFTLKKPVLCQVNYMVGALRKATDAVDVVPLINLEEVIL